MGVIRFPPDRHHEKKPKTCIQLGEHLTFEFCDSGKFKVNPKDSFYPEISDQDVTQYQSLPGTSADPPYYTAIKEGNVTFHLDGYKRKMTISSDCNEDGTDDPLC